MKGDIILLGITGAAILAVPVAVLLLSGAEPVPISAKPPSAASAVTMQTEAPDSKSSVGESWVTTPIEGGQSPAPTPSQTAKKQPEEEKAESQEKPEKSADTGKYKTNLKAFRILNRTTGKVEEVELLDYVRGAIAAEMPASFHIEALKAQGVAALTYGLCHREERHSNPDPLLLGADFSADPEKREGYMTEKAAKKFYGDNRLYNWNKVCEAADEAVQWVILSEDNKPIAAAYHAISAGSTEDAKNIWDGALPGLTPVDSSWDILAKGYKSTMTLSQGEIKEKLKDSGAVLLPNPDTWFEVLERSPSNYVTCVRVGNTEMNGNKLRNLLGLRSSSFQVERQGKDFLFLVNGYGHGAGLSQNGADYMARQGSGFAEILEHYYPSCHLTRTIR